MPPTASGDGSLPPVPDDEPTPSPVQLPWSQIPKFVPGVTNVQEYSQKLQFLASLWPVEHLDQLAPRAALLIEGTAFKKIAKIPPAKLKVKTTDGVAALVEAIGGSWGSTELEERYEYFEKSLYGTTQRNDESHDSFLARMEANFTELLSRNTTLEEVQAYVLLRQSTLSAEDKKRILLEHEGELQYKPVVKSFRLLSSRFFNEFQTGRVSQRTKVYDANFLDNSESHDAASSHDSGTYERAYLTHASSEDAEPELDQEFIDALVAQDDADALAVATFEGEFEEFLQDTPEMFEALTTYIEARSKLIEKKKSRGFWPVKGKNKHGKGKGKGFGKRSKDRDALLQKIARSHCRRCGALGHWKAECPLASGAEKSGGPPSTASANVVMDERPQEVFATVGDVDEVFSEEDDNEAYVMPSVESSLQFQSCHAECFMLTHECKNRGIHNLSQRMSSFNSKRVQRFSGKSQCACDPVESKRFQMPPRKCPDEPSSDQAPVANRSCRFSETFASEQVYSSLETFCTHAILDTGASRCIIGDRTLKRLQQSLPAEISARFRKQDSQVKFRFGNNQSLTSMYAIQMPLKHKEQKKLWLSVEVVPGATPFLFSKKAFKMLHGSLDSRTDQCFMRKVQDGPIKLMTSPTGLYLINMIDICVRNEAAMFQETASDIPVKSVPEMPDGDRLGYENHKNSIMGRTEVVLQSQKSNKPGLRFQRNRCFRSSDSQPNSNRASETCDSHAACGKHAQDDCRGHHPPADLAPPDLCASVGKTRSDHRDGDRDRSSDSWPIAGNDEPDQHAKDGIGESERRDHGPKEASRAQDSWTNNGSKLRCFRRKYNNVDVSASDRSDPAPRKSSFGRISCGHLGRDRRSDDPTECPDDSCGRAHQSRCSTSAYDAASRKSDTGRMGKQSDFIWTKAQGEVLRGSDAPGPRILSLEPSSIFELDAGATGLCPVRTAMDVEGRSMMSSPEAQQFHAEVLAARKDLQTDVTDKTNSPISHQIEQSINNLKDSLINHVQSNSNNSRIFLLEIYANNNSPLTEAVQRLGYKAMRFTKEDGDLATFAGRQKLWGLIERLQPEHIWMAPECGPWSGWNRLNMGKSSFMFDLISMKQEMQMPHVHLCRRICEYQVRLGRHFHLEQPAGSSLIQMDAFAFIRQHTVAARFDMCRFGLRIPKTNRFLKKRSQVLTTSRQLFHELNGFLCANQHSHQRIEGSISVNGQSQRLTSFCAIYCQGFAKMVAGKLCKLHHTMIGSDEHAMVFDDEEEERPKKRFKTTLQL